MLKTKLILCFLFLSFAYLATAQKAKITSIRSVEDNMIKVAIESDTEFYFGALNYYLYIGKSFFENPYIENNGNKSMVYFKIKREQYDRLPSTSNVILSYGDLPQLENVDLTEKRNVETPSGSPSFLNGFVKSMLTSK